MNSATLTKLQPGHIVMFGGARHKVVMVNESRARIVPLEKVNTEVEQIINGKKVVVASFSKYPPGQNISPNSEIEIVAYEKPIESVSGSEPEENLPRRGRGRPRKQTTPIESVEAVPTSVVPVARRLAKRK